MKKIIIGMFMMLGCVSSAFAAETQYKVYDLSLSLKTTKAAGQTQTSCGDTYTYRVKASRKIQGVIAGCGCLAMAGDPTCDNFEIYLWDATTKTQLTNFTFTTKILQRVDKAGKTVEQVVTLVAEDQAGEKFELVLAGIGSYKVSKNGKTYDTMAVSGTVTGTVDAPYKTTLGSCSACSVTPDTVDQTQAIKVCEDGICVKSDTGDVTPAYGTYSMKYNQSKSVKCEKIGVSAKTLGLPAYIKIAE